MGLLEDCIYVPPEIICLYDNKGPDILFKWTVYMEEFGLQFFNRLRFYYRSLKNNFFQNFEEWIIIIENDYNFNEAPNVFFWYILNRTWIEAYSSALRVVII